MEEILQKIKECLEDLITNDIVNAYMFNTLDTFKEKCRKEYEELGRQTSAPRDEACLETLIRRKLNDKLNEINRENREIKIKRKKPSSCDWFGRNRKLDIEIESQNNIIVLEVKLNYPYKNPQKKTGYKTWGWDEAFIQTILDAWKYPDRYRIIVIFDKIINRNLQEEEKSFLATLKNNCKIYFFRFFKIEDNIEYETNLQ